MKNYLIIDGNNIVTRAFYASSPKREDTDTDATYYAKFMQTSKGVYTNAIKIALQQILTLISKWQPNGVAVAFDFSRDTFRRLMYADYKGTRNETCEALRQQIKNMQDILKRIGIQVYVNHDFEADDIVYTIINKYKNNSNIHFDVVSSDKDYYQLVSDNVTLWAPQVSLEKANTLLDKYGFSEEEKNLFPYKYVPFSAVMVQNEFGVKPENVVDLKGIVGDTSDNIPGVKGVSSAAAPLVNYYGSVEAIYEALKTDEKAFVAKCKEIGIKRSPAKALLAGEENALLSKKLAQMVEVPNLQINMGINLNFNELERVITEYELNSFNEYHIVEKLKGVPYHGFITIKNGFADFSISENAVADKVVTEADYDAKTLFVKGFDIEGFVKNFNERTLVIVSEKTINKNIYEAFKQVINSSKALGINIKVAIGNNKSDLKFMKPESVFV